MSSIATCSPNLGSLLRIWCCSCGCPHRRPHDHVDGVSCYFSRHDPVSMLHGPYPQAIEHVVLQLMREHNRGAVRVLNTYQVGRA